MESTNKKPSTHGGKREGAGRPSIGVRKVRLTLDDETIDKGTDIGDGNLSMGVRIAVKEHKKKSGKKRTRMSDTELLDLQQAKTIRPRTVGCIVKCNRHGFLALRLFWNGMRSWEGTGLPDTPENRKLLEAAALVISSEIKKKTFDYLRHFPKGNKAHLFRLAEQLSPSHLTVEGYYKTWIKKQEERHRAHRVKDYEAIKRHILKTRTGQQAFGKIALGFLNVSIYRPCRTS